MRLQRLDRRHAPRRDAGQRCRRAPGPHPPRKFRDRLQHAIRRAAVGDRTPSVSRASRRIRCTA
ncbi:hypothetical protein MYA_3020 [Burkholderia sp. KJ006]|nr:hypothetical protein MYA_3020 [Burkholderia sp. KJ006]